MRSKIARVNWNNLYFLVAEDHDPSKGYASTETQSLVNVFSFPFIPSVGATIMGPKSYKVVDVVMDTMSNTARVYLKAVAKKT